MTRSRFCFSAAAMLLLAGLSVSAHAALITAMADPTRFGYLDQALTNCPNVACGPTAAVNSFGFLQNVYPNVYDTKLVPHTAGNTATQDQVAVANTLAGAQYMNTCQNCTTLVEDFIVGKQTYIDMVAPGMTFYAAQMDDPWMSARPQPAYVQVSTKPTPQFIADELRAGEDVEILLFRANPRFGHWVTLTEINFDTDTKVGFINFVDPLGGVLLSANITGVTNGEVDVSYFNPGAMTTCATCQITDVIAESPIPEPGTFALAGLALFALIFARLTGCGDKVRRNRFFSVADR